jgi:hypothetical protein
MPLIRGHHDFDDHFAQIPNSWLRDARLSFKARGLLALLMSHREGWSLSVNALASQNQEGKDAIRSAIQELEGYGYLYRTQSNEGGKFGEAIWITTDPSDLPLADFPTTDNPTPKNTIIKEDQVKNNKEEELFLEFWNSYPKKVDKAKAFRAFKSALKRAKFEDILAGVIAYRNDPKRNPDFTKYPASWLNADAWENAATPSYEPSPRLERDKALSREFLEEQKRQAEQAAPPPSCPHGINPARCRTCIKELRSKGG